MQRFEDQTVIVTGGGRETGVSHARGFAAEGAKLVIAGVLDEECRWLAREFGDRALFTPLDVTDEDECATVHAAEQAFGHLLDGRLRCGTWCLRPLRERVGRA